MNMKLELIKETMQGDRHALKARFSLRRLAVFGSVARGTESENSDVDILVEFDHTPGFDEFMDLKFYLEDLLGIRVDLVTTKAVRVSMKNAIEREAVNVGEYLSY